MNLYNDGGIHREEGRTRKIFTREYIRGELWRKEISDCKCPEREASLRGKFSNNISPQNHNRRDFKTLLSVERSVQIAYKLGQKKELDAGKMFIR